MANKNLPASTGYFNKKMLDILAKGESKSAPTAKNTAAKSTTAKGTTAKPKAK